MRLLPLLLLPAALAALFPDQGLPPGVKDTQNPKDKPPSPQESVKRFQLPDGFRVTLFAGEPHVHQPISMCFDERGRLWVAECFSYPDWIAPDGDKPAVGHDRILIFEDTDGDGVFDKRTVFYDKAANLTSILVGNGGVYALCAPHLLFFPDADGDGVPDGPAQVVLDGWSLKAGHNIVSGLTWGPDGWIYGRHGILHESRPGRPGTPVAERPALNCSIWRYHPVHGTVEVVCHGTTNPWGLDFNEYGDGFFVNCVIGHLWHMIPGAHYERMYGLDYNPYTYELLGATSDHLHWGGGHWTDSRNGVGIHDAAGGGHAHAGAAVYLGDNFPEKYRGSIFMGNLHGNRLNINLLQRQGSGYVGKRAPDFFRTDNPWFRPIELQCGPEGGLYVGDWCDYGECHDNDGVHRSSGRIYRITYSTPKVAPFDLRKSSDLELVKLHLHKNEWYARQARRLLTERRKKLGKEVAPELRKIFAEDGDTVHRLRALWTLYGIGAAGKDWLRECLADKNEYVRAWAVQLLFDHHDPKKTSGKLADQLAALARDDASARVRLSVASALQRLPAAERVPIARRLLEHQEDAKDAVLPLMIWYGIEPAARADGLLEFIAEYKIPKVRQFLVRRLTEGTATDAKLWPRLLGVPWQRDDDQLWRDWLRGVHDGLKGRRNEAMPAGWAGLAKHLQANGSAEVRELTDALGLVFGDSAVVARYKGLIADVKAEPARRTAALAGLVRHRPAEVKELVLAALDDPVLRGAAVQALAVYDDPQVPTRILEVYPKLGTQEKAFAVSTLSSRASYALALLDAVAKKTLPREEISVFAARQMADLKNKQVSERLAKVWGSLRSTSGDKKALIAKYKALLPPEEVARGDASRGRVVFNKLCAQCHLLFGEGKKIGPDLTGSNRNDLHYVLENIIDPSAVIGKDYQLTNITTKSGRFISGIVVAENDQALTVQIATERLEISRAEIELRQLSNVSMMPEGQIEQMTLVELRDLVRYLGSKEQVPLPK
jgi:putative membrane-bound dehydrogenase-like protein